MQFNKLETIEDLENLFKTLNEAIYKYIFIRCGYKKEIAEDLAQDVFIKAWEKRSTFNPKKSSLKNWIYIIARNHLIDYFRSNKITSFGNMDLFSNHINTIDTIEKEIMVNTVMRNLESLSESEKEVIILRYIQELDLNNISKILNKNYIATKVMLFRAINKLKRKIKN